MSTRSYTASQCRAYALRNPCAGFPPIASDPRLANYREGRVAAPLRRAIAESELLAIPRNDLVRRATFDGGYNERLGKDRTHCSSTQLDRKLEVECGPRCQIVEDLQVWIGQTTSTLVLLQRVSEARYEHPRAALQALISPHQEAWRLRGQLWGANHAMHSLFTRAKYVPWMLSPSAQLLLLTGCKQVPLKVLQLWDFPQASRASWRRLCAAGCLSLSFKRRELSLYGFPTTWRAYVQ